MVPFHDMAAVTTAPAIRGFVVVPNNHSGRNMYAHWLECVILDAKLLVISRSLIYLTSIIFTTESKHRRLSDTFESRH
jgi:hypothetical protein